jgi:hypothetical protein
LVPQARAERVPLSGTNLEPLTSNLPQLSLVLRVWQSRSRILAKQDLGGDAGEFGRAAGVGDRPARGVRRVAVE